MVQENSMRNDSYFYSIEHAARKSFYHVFGLIGDETPPYMDENGLPGVIRIKYIECQLVPSGQKKGQKK